MVRRVRLLLVADTHLGFDLPLRERVKRRRRGPDFFACFERALEPALAGEADLVVHGGDLLYRSRVPPALVHRALEPLRRVASRGVPVFIVPGNHERSALPYPILAAHRSLLVFDRPRTFVCEAGGCRVALGGFPFAPRVRARFRQLVLETGLHRTPADVRLLCIHQAVEGARVGPQDFTFRHGDDVVRGSDLPGGIAAVLAGHIHRGQVLPVDLSGRKLPAPVLYPGSVERTSFAERDEPKGYLRLELAADGSPGGTLAGWEWMTLPARPMLEVHVDGGGQDAGGLAAQVRSRLAELPQDAVVRLRIRGPLGPSEAAVLSAEHLRTLAPPGMNVSTAWPEEASATSGMQGRLQLLGD